VTKVIYITSVLIFISSLTKKIINIQMEEGSLTKSYRVAILGATGAVGRVVGITRTSFSLADLKLLASPRSSGRTLQFQGENLPVEPVGSGSLITWIWFWPQLEVLHPLFGLPIAVAAGAVVIDNSSAFRLDPSP